MRVLYNVYFVLFFLILGPEAVAKSLPMKKVQTVETVWVPMSQEEVDQSVEAIEAVEIEDTQQGAVPLFKEATTPAPPAPARDDPRPKVVSQSLPGVQVQRIEGEGPEERPIIQVIYQGVKDPSVPPAQPPALQDPKPAPTVPVPVTNESLKPLESPVKNKKVKGDVYNFYFSS